MTARRFATITIVKKTEFGDASPIHHWRNATLSNSLRSNNRSGVGRQSVVPFHSTSASPPTLLIPLQSGKTVDILRCAPEIHRLAFRLPHSVPPNQLRQCASAKSGHPHPLRLQDSRRQHGWCSKVSSLSAAPPRRDTAASAAGLQRSRCRDFRLSPKARRLDLSLPHRPTGAIIRPAP